MRTSVIILALLTASACQQTPKGDRPPVTEAEAVKIAETAEATFTGNDPDRIMDQYVDGAVMIDAATANPIYRPQGSERLGENIRKHEARGLPCHRSSYPDRRPGRIRQFGRRELHRVRRYGATGRQRALHRRLPEAERWPLENRS